MSNETPFSVFGSSDIGSGNVKLSDNLLFNNASDFSHFVEVTALRQDKTCSEVILEYCDSKDIEPDQISKLVSVSLKGKIQAEMIEAGLLEQHSTIEGF